MTGGPVVADTSLEELMAMTVPELVSWLTKNNVTLPSSKQTKQYYRNLAMQTPNVILGGEQLGDTPLGEQKTGRPQRKKEPKSPAKQITPQATALAFLSSPSMTTRSKHAALRAQMELDDTVPASEVAITDKEIEMDFPREAGEVVAAPEPESAAVGEEMHSYLEGRDGLLQNTARPSAIKRNITTRPSRLASKVYYVPIFILVIAVVAGVLTQFYAFHVVIDPTSSKYQLSVTPRYRQP